jgi:hypothetical protein
MYPIASVIVGSSGASNIVFGSGNTLPQNFTHLQLRAFVLSTNSGNPIWGRFNGDSGSNYNAHYLYANGSTVSSGQGSAAPTYFSAGYTATSSTTIPNVIILDILDYSNTNKNKTTRSIEGGDANGSGFVEFESGLWLSTAAITSITLYATNNNFAQNTRFDLYGISTSNATGA